MVDSEEKPHTGETAGRVIVSGEGGQQLRDETKQYPNVNVSVLTFNFEQYPPINIAPNTPEGGAKIMVHHEVDSGVQGRVEETMLLMNGVPVYRLQPGVHDVQPGRYSMHQVRGRYYSPDGSKGIRSVVRYKSL